MILTEDQRALTDAARRFSREVLLPGYQQRESQGRIDWSLLGELVYKPHDNTQLSVLYTGQSPRQMPGGTAGPSSM